MAPRRKEKYKLPVPLPEGKILDDMEGNQWALGKMIGSGGFGLIYLAFPTNKPNKDARHVIKVEYQENGPLFSELKFYQRAAKRECIQKWVHQKKLDYLGVPIFYGFGLTDFKGRSYRFMVMERLGIDLQKLLDQNGIFKKLTVLQLGIRMLDVLEYIHENEYVHGDIKAANLLLGYTNPDRVYLADYGLSYRYRPNGNHKQYQEDPRKSHNGTIEFTSLDAHKGVGELVEFLMYVHNLAYDDKPDYQKLKKILNPDGIPLGSLEFSTKAQSVNVRTPTHQKVDSPKATRKPANEFPAKFTRKVCSEARAMWREEKVESRPSVLLNRVAAPENSRTRKIHEYTDIFSEMQSLGQTPSYTSFQGSYCKPYLDCNSRDPIRKPRSLPQYRYTPTGNLGVTDLESSPRLWPAVFQLSLSEETKADMYYYGLTIFCLLTLVCLALYFL